MTSPTQPNLRPILPAPQIPKHKQFKTSCDKTKNSPYCN